MNWNPTALLLWAYCSYFLSSAADRAKPFFSDAFWENRVDLNSTLSSKGNGGYFVDFCQRGSFRFLWWLSYVVLVLIGYPIWVQFGAFLFSDANVFYRLCYWSFGLEMQQLCKTINLTNWLYFLIVCLFKLKFKGVPRDNWIQDW